MGRGTDRLFFSLLNKFCFKLICLHLDVDVIEGESLMWKSFARPAVLGFFFFARILYSLDPLLTAFLLERWI